MDANVVRSRVLATLSPDANVRRAAEIELKQVRLSTSIFLNPLFDRDAPPGLQTSLTAPAHVAVCSVY